MVSLNKKKEVLNDWCEAFPCLSKYSPSTLFMTLDIALIGLSLERLPRCEEYRPLLICYPLWRENNKKNLDEPIFMREISDRRNFQLDILYETHQCMFTEAVKCTQKQVGKVLKESISVKSIIELLKLQFADLLVKSSPVIQARLLEYEFSIALFFNDPKLIQEVKHKIETVSKSWEPHLFEWKYGKIEDWTTSLFNNIQNRDIFIAKINENLLDKKISKLKIGHMYI